LTTSILFNYIFEIAVMELLQRTEKIIIIVDGFVPICAWNFKTHGLSQNQSFPLDSITTVSIW